MLPVDGTLARKLDFGELTTLPSARAVEAALYLAPRLARLAGPDKYKVLEHRRRQAQIKARRLLEDRELDSARKTDSL
jgi:hypothetical protein